MKSIVRYGLALLLSVGMVSNCLAITLSDDPTIDVGDVDDLLQIASSGTELTLTTLPDSGDATETAWVDLVLTSLGIDTTDLTLEVKIEDATIYTTSETDVYAADISTDSTAVLDYFIVKNSTYWALFDNNVELDWAVFDASLLPDDMNINDVIWFITFR